MEYVRKRHVYVFVKHFGCIIYIGHYLEMVNPIVVCINNTELNNILILIPIYYVIVFK